MTITIKPLSIGLALLLCACGSTPDPKDPSDINPDDPIQQKMPIKPKRVVSKAVKDEFKDAVKEYKGVKRGGAIDKSACSKIAGMFAEIYQSHPKIPEAKFNEGVIWQECGEVNKAKQIYNELLRRHPNYGPALNNIGQINFKRGDTGGAFGYFEKAIASKTSEAYSNLAVIQRNRAKRGEIHLIKEVVNNVHRALAVDSFNIEAYGTLALVLYDHAKTKSQLEMARLICVQATKVDPNYAPVYNTLGLILLRQRNVTAALAKFRKAVSLDNDFLEAHMNIGAITISFRDYKSAEEAFSKVLSLNPSKEKKVDALIGLGVAYRGQRKFQQAMAQYNQAKSLDPTRASISYNIGILIQDYTFDASNPAKAIQDLKQAARFLQTYVSQGRNESIKRDCRRRLKNINDLIPMLREQQKMMKGMQNS